MRRNAQLIALSLRRPIQSIQYQSNAITCIYGMRAGTQRQNITGPLSFSRYKARASHTDFIVFIYNNYFIYTPGKPSRSAVFRVFSTREREFMNAGNRTGETNSTQKAETAGAAERVYRRKRMTRHAAGHKKGEETRKTGGSVSRIRHRR